jgi:hypothetical protein
VVTACPICQGPVPQPARGRPRAYCSRACQAKGYRTRAAAAASAAFDSARVEMPGEPGAPLREYGDAVLLAAREMARVLDDGAAAVPAATRLARAARELAVWADGIAVPAPAPAPAAAPAPPLIPARDEIREGGEAKPCPARQAAPVPARDETGTEKQRQRRPRRMAEESTRDESPAPQEVPRTPALPTWDTTAIKPVPQRLPKKKAEAILDAAELVRAPDYRDSHAWILHSGDTLIGYVVPSYGGTSRSGRNGWVGRLGSTPGPRCHSRDGAKMDLASQWLRVVTAAPKR